MVSIVITHGRSQEFGIGETLEENWTRALRQGLANAKAPFARSIPVDFAFYGTLWRPDAGEFAPDEVERGGSEPERGDDEPPSALQARVAGEMLAAAPAATVAETERLGWDTISDLVGDLDDALGLGKLALRHFLKDIDRYFSDATLRDKAIATVVDTVRASDAPVALLAHSLGTIVAYDALRRHPDLPVPGFVTFGSPLGLATVRERLQDTGGDLVYPPSVRRWANIFEKRDFVAAGIELEPLYTAADGRTVEDRTSKGKRPGIGDIVAAHDAIVYLSSAALAKATRSIVDAVTPVAANGHGEPERGTRGRPTGAAAAPPDFAFEVTVPPEERTAAAPPPEPELAGAEEPMRDVTRAAAASFPPLVAPGETHELTFQIGTRQMVGGDAVEDFTASLPASLTTLDLTVVVQAPDFDVVDGRGSLASKAVPISLDLTNESALIEGSFRLRAHDTDARRSTDVRLRILHDNNPIGMVTLPTLIAPAGAGGPVHPAQLSGAMRLRASEAPGAELTLYVNSRDGGETFDISATIRGGDERHQPIYELGSFPVKKGAWEYSRHILEEFRAVRELPRNDRRGRVNALGIELWDNLPRAFREFYWEHVHGEVETILICSDEPYLPWELIKPQRSPGGRTAPMLGLAYEMARWDDGLALPGDALVVSDFVVVAPAYRDQPALPSADLEAGELVAQFRARREEPGSRAQVTRLFKAKSLQVLHFSGHGEFRDVASDSQISLADAALDTVDVRTATFAKRPNPPIVFLNACEVGGQGWSLTKIGGWAEAFCQAGATGFVGPYWPVADGVARKAATVFYRSLQAGATVGEAMVRIRERFTQDEEFRYHPSWLAYSLHCHPNVTVRLGGA